MTEEESLELERLEVNARRLVGIISDLGGTLQKLRADLRSREEEISILRSELQIARQQEATHSLASALQGLDPERSRDDARALLDEIISEVDRCIRQLSAEEA